MTKNKDATFASLVQKIDEKWGHTYEDVPPETPLDQFRVRQLKDLYKEELELNK
jgi:hypothetical protein